MNRHEPVIGRWGIWVCQHTLAHTVKHKHINLWLIISISSKQILLKSIMLYYPSSSGQICAVTEWLWFLNTTEKRRALFFSSPFYFSSPYHLHCILYVSKYLHTEPVGDAHPRQIFSPACARSSNKVSQWKVFLKQHTFCQLVYLQKGKKQVQTQSPLYTIFFFEDKTSNHFFSDTFMWPLLSYSSLFLFHLTFLLPQLSWLCQIDSSSKQGYVVV
jgi:hypothetical protein